MPKEKKQENEGKSEGDSSWSLGGATNLDCPLATKQLSSQLHTHLQTCLHTCISAQIKLND